MTRVERTARRTLRAFRHRNDRLFVAGPVASISGTWIGTDGTPMARPTGSEGQ